MKAVVVEHYGMQLDIPLRKQPPPRAAASA